MTRNAGSVPAGGGHTIRGRIIRIVAPPLVAMVVLLTVFSAGEVASYRAATAAEDRVRIIFALQSLVQELQNERGLTVALITGNTEVRPQLDPARQKVDNQRLAVRSLLAGGGTVEDEAADSVDRLDDLAEVRAGTDNGTADRDKAFETYTTLIEELSDNTRHLAIVSDDELRRGAESVEQLVEVREATAQEQVFLSGVISAGGFRDGEFSEFLDIIAARDLFLTELEEFASPATSEAMTALLGGEAAVKARALEQKALSSGDGEKLSIGPQAWSLAQATVLDDLTRLAFQVGEQTQDRAEYLRQRATIRTALLATVVLLCLTGSLFLATAGTRSLAGPLGALADEADRLARERLPEAVRRAAAGDAAGPPGPVQVSRGATREVRQVADAFDRVRETAYVLATEQAQLRRTSAESLANLGRRNQNLLGRQLSLITRLEREEPDPTGLANLFELDHLATRMRRNAESLLVLVGAASPRQWDGHLPVTDVIRAAVSEVEEYRRVILRRTEDAMVQGWVASGVAHMLAELIENGLSFSPPDVEVEIHGRVVGGDYLIAVCDQGVGMSDAEMRVANERLRGDGDFLEAPARFLGHYVVGRLAAELGVQVQVTTSPVTGVTARIRLPAGILSETPAVAAAPAAPEPAVTGHATDEAQVPPARIRPRALEVDYVVVEQRPAVPAPRSTLESTPMPALSFEPGGDEVERTRNGLRKRVPGGHRPYPVTVPAAPRHEAPAADSPLEVASRMSALRDGIRRGSSRP